MLNPDMPTSELLLHMGELTKDEILVARAALKWADRSWQMSHDTSSMIHYAFRYCLGRRTYAGGECIDYLKKHWLKIHDMHKKLIVKEVKLALKDHATGDAKEWKEFLDKVEGK